jgi:hypothetical protein
VGFRNPVNSISGDQITPGTITGSTFRTAATGNRAELTASGGVGRLNFYSGSGGAAASIVATTNGGAAMDQALALSSGDGGGALTLSAEVGLHGWQSRLDLTATALWVNAQRPLLGFCGVATATTSHAGLITLNHNLGVVPVAVLCSPGDGAVRLLADFITLSSSTSQTQILVVRRDSNTAFADNPVTFQWVAFVPFNN